MPAIVSIHMGDMIDSWSWSMSSLGALCGLCSIYHRYLHTVVSVDIVGTQYPATLTLSRLGYTVI